jgi:hypothetical protein
MTPADPGDPRLDRLLRWYPRAWRERYGDEFLAMVEDTLDGRPPGWRLRLGVVWAGLRERGHQARWAAPRVLRGLTGTWWRVFVAGYILAILPYELRVSPPPARAWQVTAALSALTAVVAVAGAAVLAGTLAALPAFVRFLRAGGWPKIRSRVWRAVAATAVAAGALAGLVLAGRGHTFAQLNESSTYFAWVMVAALTIAVALGLWTSAATAAAKQLDLSPRVRAAEKRLGAAADPAVSVMISVTTLFYAAVQSSVPLLLLGLSWFALQVTGAYVRRRRTGRHAPSPVRSK